MLMPKKVKYRKQQRGRMTGKPGAAPRLAFGEYGLKAMRCGWITDRQIEAARVAMTRFIKRGGKVWIRLFPDKPITKKPAETRMGKGKGAPEQWVAVIRPGKILFEMEGVPKATAQEAFRLAAGEAAAADQSGEPRRQHRRIAGRLARENNNESETKYGNSIATELRRQLAENSEQNFRLRFQLSMGQADGLKKLRVLRKDQARMLTILRDRELHPETAPEPMPKKKKKGK